MDSEPSPTEPNSDISTNKGALTLVPDLDDGSTSEPSEDAGPLPVTVPIGVSVVGLGSRPGRILVDGTYVGLCQCGKRPKRRGKGRKLCQVCADHAEALTLCDNCGADKDAPGNAGRLCMKCRKIPKRARQRKGLTPEKRRKRCTGCGGRKEPGRCFAYCSQCRADREAYRRPCAECKERPVREGRYMRLCQPCIDAQSLRERTYKREYWRRARDERLAAETLEKAPQYTRLAQLLLGRQQELDELVWHVEREVTPTTHLQKPSQVDFHSFPDLPAQPLGFAIQRLIDSERHQLYFHAPTLRKVNGRPVDDHVRTAICGRLGISDRAYTNWKKDGTTVEFDIADDVMIRGEWNWFEVWDREQYPDVAAVFESEDVMEMSA